MSNDELRKEIDELLAHWISHTCSDCGDDEDRLPTKWFPAIFKFLGERKND